MTASVQAKANSTPLASEFSARACEDLISSSVKGYLTLTKLYYHTEATSAAH